MLAKVANKDTQSVVSALIKQSQKLPRELYKSLTWDWTCLDLVPVTHLMLRNQFFERERAFAA